MDDETTVTDRRLQHRVAMVCGSVIGVAVFIYLAITQHLVRGRPYGPFWWTNLVLGVVVFGGVGALAAVLVYMGLRRERTL